MQNLENAADQARRSVSHLMAFAILGVLALGAGQSLADGSLRITTVAVIAGLAGVFWMTGRAAHRAIAVLRKAVRSGA